VFGCGPSRADRIQLAPFELGETKVVTIVIFRTFYGTVAHVRGNETARTTSRAALEPTSSTPRSSYLSIDVSSSSPDAHPISRRFRLPRVSRLSNHRALNGEPGERLP